MSFTSWAATFGFTVSLMAYYIVKSDGWYLLTALIWAVVAITSIRRDIKYDTPPVPWPTPWCYKIDSEFIEHKWAYGSCERCGQQQ